MSDENDYGKNEKRIIFTDTDHRHAQLVLKLKGDGLTKSKFFRCIISGYLRDDERIKQFIIENSTLSNKRKKTNLKLYNEGKQTSCAKSGCKYFIDYDEEYNCTLVSIYENGRMTLREIGDRLGISFARVKQIEAKALQKIKNTDLIYFKDME